MKRILSFILVLVVIIVMLPHEVLAAKKPKDIESQYTYTVQNGTATITEYIGSETNITIPSKLGGYPVKAIGEKAFMNNRGIQTVKVSQGITYIGRWAFAYCTSLTSVSLPTGIKTIIMESFRDTTSLTSINFPNGLVSIETFAFLGSALVNVKLPKTMTRIESQAFEGCLNLKSCTIPASVTYIGSDAFHRDIPPSFTLYVVAGSYAETYAIDNNLPYVAK